MSFITARGLVLTEVVLCSLRGSVLVKKDCPSVGVSDSCQVLGSMVPAVVLSSTMPALSPSVGISDSCRFAAVRCQRQGQGIRRQIGTVIVWSLAVRCQRQIQVRGCRRIGPSSCWYGWQYGASGCFSVGVPAQSLISRVMFHKHIGAESYRFRSVVYRHDHSVGL